jgi:uncharacterized protein
MTSNKHTSLGWRGLIRVYWMSLVITGAVLALVGWQFGALITFTVLVPLIIIEVTFSFDNAVVNSKVLKTMSPRWQMIFMTVGIFIAVFVVRFALPIFIVMLTAGLGFVDVIDMALNRPDDYARELHTAAPMIDAFGGTFLLMIGISYFFDPKKDLHWLGWIERRLAPLGKVDNFTPFIMILAAAVLYFTTDPKNQGVVLVSAILCIALHIGLDLFGSLFEKEDEDETGDSDEKPATKQTNGLKQKVGWAAFASFMYLEVLDGSFSFDGVIGAFAITLVVQLIVAGLGVGAMWVRSMTVHLLRAGTLAKFRYLEHGAYWAILALGSVMYLKLYHIEPPEWFTGSLGLLFIGAAVISSKRVQKREDREALIHTTVGPNVTVAEEPAGRHARR